MPQNSKIVNGTLWEYQSDQACWTNDKGEWCCNPEGCICKQCSLASQRLIADTPIDREIGWLIESENQLYIGELTTFGYPSIGWVSDSNKALRMARKEDAEALQRICKVLKIGFHDEAKGVTEHVWYA